MRGKIIYFIYLQCSNKEKSNYFLILKLSIKTDSNILITSLLIIHTHTHTYTKIKWNLVIKMLKCLSQFVLICYDDTQAALNKHKIIMLFFISWDDRWTPLTEINGTTSMQHTTVWNDCCILYNVSHSVDSVEYKVCISAVMEEFMCTVHHGYLKCQTHLGRKRLCKCLRMVWT